MTVGIAALFSWNYAKGGQTLDLGRAVIIVSDRMITAGDIQYEPPQQKVARITDHVWLVVAGDYDLHSEAINNLQAHAQKVNTIKPFDAAVMYGAQIQAIQRRHAEALYLAPLGLNTDSFLAQQREMSGQLVDAITSQLQAHEGSSVQAIIAGVDTGDGHAHIYLVDHRGMVRCFDDVGFVAIGSGAWHAQSAIMQTGYINSSTFGTAATTLFAAKKAAEVAPGVGSYSDVRILTRESCFTLKGNGNSTWERIADELEKIHAKVASYRNALHTQAVKELEDALNAPTPQEPKDLTNVTPISTATGGDSKNS